MSARNPTPEQRAAIEAAGEVLVSASAGSGKTFVMIEKIISLILSGKADVSSVLAVTFTNLAAAEMKERLKKALSARINEETDASVRARLKTQLFEVGTADICTLHSFCSNVIRCHFYRTDADGNFRVAEEDEADKLRKRAAETVFEEKLANGDEGFFLLSRAFAGSRGFSRLTNALLEGYERVSSRADYKEFLANIPSFYTEEGFSRLSAEAFQPVRRRAEKLLAEAREAKKEAEAFVREGIMGEKHVAFCTAREALAEKLLAASSFSEGAAVALGTALPPKPANTKLKNTGRDDALALDARMASFKELTDKIRDLFGGETDESALRESFFSSGKIASAFSELLLAFDGEYARLKRRAGALDFSDLEHKCLALLRMEDVRAEVRGRYTHVFVDEYQDVNPAQEEILSLVAGENVFMVGDAKQSIYGFRGCSAAFFTEKYARLKKSGGALELNGNFRSADAVLGAVNGIFSRAMTKETCSIDYPSTSVMTGGGAYPEGSGRVRFDFIPEKEKEERETPDVYSVADNLGAEGAEESAEGALIAKIIAEELSKTRYDVSAGGYEKIGFKDIAVLTRGKTAKAERIIAELVRRGVPVASSAEYNICDYPEVKTMLDVLRFVDNAAEDIPLASSLKGLGKVSDAELAKIRLSAKEDTPFYVAAREYARKEEGETAEKLRKFYAFMRKLRLLASVKSAAEIMSLALSETEFELSLLSMPCGAERVSRVMRLIAEAGELSVGEFLDKLKAGGYRVGFSESGGENAVKVMTMHASKGLEFPVVIVAGMNDRFSGEDMKGDFLYDEEWGFAPCAYDFENYRLRDTLLRRVVRARLAKKRAEDEMRLLYVAATRAEYSLHFLFTERKQFDLFRVPEAACFADFIDFAALGGYVAEGDGGELPAFSERVLVLGQKDEEAEREVKKRYRLPYAHEESLSLPVKTSASEILKERGEPFYAENSMVKAADPVPAADAATGTAYHAFLERADFSAPADKEAARVLACMQNEDPAAAALLSEDKMREILSLPVFSSLSGCTLFREREFLLSVPAKEVLDSTSDDHVLMQGVIDLMAVRGEECILLDYKYSSHDAENLVRTYLPQLRVYAAAARRAQGVKKVSAYLVNILRGEAVKVL